MDKRRRIDLLVARLMYRNIAGAPGMPRHAATTMNLFPICEGGDAESRNVKFMDLFPQHAGFGSTKEDVSKTNNSRCAHFSFPVLTLGNFF